MMYDNNLHVVSNRLPVTVKKGKDGSYSCQKSCGALVTGMKGVSECSKFKWYGWPGLETRGKDADKLRETLMDEHQAVPLYHRR
jgi:trehalose 6-phosphate synthase